CFVPVPEKEGDHERGMGVRPRGIEVHVNGKRAGPPDGEGRQQRPALLCILTRHAKGDEQSKKTVERGGECHGDSIGGGKTVRGNGRTRRSRQQNGRVSEQKKRRPKNRGAHAEMIVEVARAGAEDLLELTVLIDAALAKTGVGLKIVGLEIQIVLNQGSSKECVVSDTVSAYPGVEQRQGEEKKQEQQAL